MYKQYSPTHHSTAHFKGGISAETLEAAGVILPAPVSIFDLESKLERLAGDNFLTLNREVWDGMSSNSVQDRVIVIARYRAAIAKLEQSAAAADKLEVLDFEDDGEAVDEYMTTDGMMER